MISTPAAPRQHPHLLSQHFQAPFREHLPTKRQPAHSMFPLSHRDRNARINKDTRYGFEQGDIGGFRQGFYAMSKATARPVLQQVEPGASEHMLRRKTPNGTLKAGYDGTPVEWASGPPAHKHHLLRNSQQEDVSDTLLRRQTCFLFNSQDLPSGSYPLTKSDKASNNPGSYNSFDFNLDTVPLNNRQYLQRPSQGQPMDSMLYQATPQGQPFPNAFGNLQIAMQPTWPRNIEPTASAPQMPYGPYWPNGAFEPYRPTAVRDGRFPSQADHASLNLPTEKRLWLSQEQCNSRLPPGSSIYLGPASAGLGTKVDPQMAFQPPQLVAQPYASDSLYTDMNLPHGEQMVHDNHTGVLRQPIVGTGTSILAERNQLGLNGLAQVPHLQFKDMAFVQAHRTYVKLLASIHQVRKQMQHNKQVLKNIPNVNLLPKPPRNSYSLETGALQQTPTPDPRLHHRSQSYSAYSAFSPGQLPVPIGTTQSITHEAQSALELLRQLAQESGWTWIDAILLGGCLAYGLNDLPEAIQWFQKVLLREPTNVEALSNMAAAYMSLNRRKEAESLWTEAVKLRPAYFEAVEHLVGLLCIQQRAVDAIDVIQYVESSLKYASVAEPLSSRSNNVLPLVTSNTAQSNPFQPTVLERSGYRSQSSENGRLIALVHAKGNMLYAIGNVVAAAQAFEEAIMIAVGRTVDGISGLIQRILRAFAVEICKYKHSKEELSPLETILLLPKTATKTAQLTFPHSSPLPGLRDVPEGQARKAAIAVTSNCLLSLAKIYQDSMSSGGVALGPSAGASGVQDILSLYYLSLSLQPSPSTANNVGILLAGVQQSASSKLPLHLQDYDTPPVAGVVPGTGIALALAYYNFGLKLDKEHAHLYTNLGSLLKDLGQLELAIKMYEQAVRCDGKFDIALANLANAVKDRGRINDAIGYYKRAVDSNADFAEAVCGLANALNSVCGWTGRGGLVFNDRRYDRWHVDEEGMLVDARDSPLSSAGWIGRVVAIVNKQLNDGRAWGKNLLRGHDPKKLVRNAAVHDSKQAQHFLALMSSWLGVDHEGAKVVRFVERATRRIAWQWYQDRYVNHVDHPLDQYQRPQLPAALTVPNAPTVLPFHTFTCPLTATQIRQISQRNGLRISASTLKSPWLPAHVYPPPPPPRPYLNVGYVSSDFNNHPLAHLMQSVFGMHNPNRVRAFCYATTPSDKSSHRQKIEDEAPVFYDASMWPVDKLVTQIVKDEIHILVNLNGYTRGARNEVFAARPAPIQMSFMGFAGTLGAEWCDYLLADEIAVPPTTLRPYRGNVTLEDVTQDDNFSDTNQDWIYGENIIYTRDTFFCCDHRQSAPDALEEQLAWPDELERRRAMRKELFPNLADDVVILGNFNQLYKIEPTTFRTWLRILQAVPKAILWLLRFPDLGETNLRNMAEKWSTLDVSSRIIFTDVAPKHQHISRARVCDLFLDTPECNAHTTAADVLWSGTPLLTYPRYEFKMCSRMAASILRGAMPRNEAGRQAARELTVNSDEEYEERAIELAGGLAEVLLGRKRECRLLGMRKIIYEGRWSSPLFNTKRWTTDLEKAYNIAWDRWVQGNGGDIWL